MHVVQVDQALAERVGGGGAGHVVLLVGHQEVDRQNLEAVHDGVHRIAALIVELERAQQRNFVGRVAVAVHVVVADVAQIVAELVQRRGHVLAGRFLVLLHPGLEVPQLVERNLRRLVAVRGQLEPQRIDVAVGRGQSLGNAGLLGQVALNPVGVLLNQIVERNHHAVLRVGGDVGAVEIPQVNIRILAGSDGQVKFGVHVGRVRDLPVDVHAGELLHGNRFEVGFEVLDRRNLTGKDGQLRARLGRHGEQVGVGHLERQLLGEGGAAHKQHQRQNQRKRSLHVCTSRFSFLLTGKPPRPVLRGGSFNDIVRVFSPKIKRQFLFCGVFRPKSVRIDAQIKNCHLQKSARDRYNRIVEMTFQNARDHRALFP